VAYRRERRREVREDTNFHVKSVAPNIYRIFGYSVSILADYSVFGQWPNKLFVASLVETFVILVLTLKYTFNY